MTGRRSWLTDLLLAALGASSWLAINGVWAELPLLVAALPEAWTLPSHLAVVIQLANAGPLLYAFVLYQYGGWLADGGRRRVRLRRLETVTIVLMLAVSAAACFLAAGLWRRTVPLHALTPHVGDDTVTGSSSSATGGATAGGGKAGERSVALLSLVFCIALVDCTSSVVYVPFTARFQARYMLAYMAGEGLSGLLPSLAALAQGVGGNTACVNISSYGAAEPYTSTAIVTSLPAAAAATLAQVEPGQQLGNYTAVPSPPPSLLETTQLVPAAVAPRFSVGVFFCLLGAMTLASLAAFALLLLLPALQSSREPPPAPVLSSRSYSPRLPSAVRWSEALSISAAAAATSSSAAASGTRPTSSSTSTTPAHPSCSAVSSAPPSATAALISAVSSRRIYLQLLLAQAVLCAVSNGLLPSLQTYSILPYGNMAFHLVASLGLAANPLACLALAWRPCRRLTPVALSALTSLLLAGYLLYTAVQSPQPPLQHSAIGCVIIVAVWLLYIGLCTYAKVSIAGLLRPHGHRPLFWYGVNTQAGSLAGAVAGYIAVNVYHAFDIYQPC